MCGADDEPVACVAETPINDGAERRKMNGAELTIIGNLTKEPELRFTKSGIPVTSFSVAVNRRAGEGKEQEVSYFDCIAWRELAEHVAESLNKGTRVIVQGRLDQRSWKTEKDETRTKYEITADAVAVELRWATAQVTPAKREGSKPIAPTDAAPGPGDYAPAAAGHDDSPF